MYFGADYYPEHWPEERWEEDVRLMKQLGLDVIRMGEFSWAKFEPRTGEFDFGWLDRAVELLADNGIKTILGTPTATPPAWIIEQSPEILPIDQEGRVRGFGGRHHDCQSNPIYHAHIDRLVRAMANHYKDNTHVIGWQTDNEYGNSHMDLCYCDSCQKGFHQWLEEKYGTIEALNQAWGTAFWSQTYDHFGQIPTPKITPNSHNPSLLLDWKRYCSDLVVEFQQIQIDIIREICPQQFHTHNFMGFHDKVDYFDLAKPLDFVSHDQYPVSFPTERPAAQQPETLAATLDLVRGFKQQSFWIMEQQAGPTGWQLIGRSPRPGQLRLWTAQTIAHGADTVVYFRWRTCSFGTEQYWHGILPHSGTPNRRYKELQRTISDLAPVMEACKGALPPAEAAILFDYGQNWALEIQPHHPELDYIDQITKYYNSFYEKNIPVNFINQSEDFSKYRLLVAPLLYLMDEELERKLGRYVENGGHLILTMRTGVKDETNICMTHRELPGNLGDLLGVEITDYDCLRDLDMSVSLDGEEFPCFKWCDIITPKGANIIATYTMDYYTGEPAITSNPYGDGIVYYVGTEPGAELMEALMKGVFENVGINLELADINAEATIRSNEGVDYLFVLNHEGADRSVNIPEGWEPVFSDVCSGILPPYGIAVYKR